MAAINTTFDALHSLVGPPEPGTTTTAAPANAPINTAANVWATNSIAQNPTASQAQTNVWNVDPTKQTTSGQLGEILKTDNPLMQTAATQAKQDANNRGLINSTMAVQAGQQAMINSATPIAQNNASTYASNAQFNTQQANAMGQFNSAEQNKLLQTSLDLNNRTELANIEANYKNLMQANSSAYSTWQQTLKNISDIQTNADMDAKTKTAAVKEQTDLLKNSFSMLGAMNNLNLAELLNF